MVHVKTFFCLVPLILALALMLFGCAGIEPGDGRVTVHSASSAAEATSDRFPL